MSINFQTKVKAFKNGNFNVEVFDSANEVVEVSSRRTRTSTQFYDMSNPSEIDAGWTGVSSLDEALELMRGGYQPTVSGKADQLFQRCCWIRADSSTRSSGSPDFDAEQLHEADQGKGAEYLL